MSRQPDGAEWPRRKPDFVKVGAFEIEPSDFSEYMLAVQMTLGHRAAMRCLVAADSAGDAGNDERRFRNLNFAAKLLALYPRQMEALDKHRGKGQQRVTVEHIHIGAGGQAVVGNVRADSSKAREPSNKGSVQIEEKAQKPFEMPDPTRAQAEAQSK